MADLWDVKIQDSQQDALQQVQQQAMTQQQVRDEATDVYRLADATSLSNPLPLIIAAYPNEAANTLRIASDLGTASLATSTQMLDVTLPGSDLLVEMSADIKWQLPVAASSTTAQQSATTTTLGGSNHTHTITSLVLANEATHTHDLAGSGTLPVAGTSDRVTAATELHTHKFLSSFGGGGDGFGDGGWAYKDVDGEYLVMGSTSNHSDKHTWAPDGTVGDGFFYEVYVSGSNHTHALTGVTSAAGTGHTHSVTSSALANESSHTHNMAHTHTVGATSAALDVRVELVVDQTVVTAGLSQFHVEGFTGASGAIQLRSVYILRKAYADALSAGQHTVGLQFTVTTSSFVATSTVDANNIALILRDASFDERVKVFTP